MVGTTFRAWASAQRPPNQTVAFYNARLALRDDHAADMLKLWLVRNALVDRGEPGTHDEEFRSAVRATLGRLGLCPDGFARDDRGGSGLWPLAMHNWVLDAMRRGPP